MGPLIGPEVPPIRSTARATANNRMAATAVNLRARVSLGLNIGKPGTAAIRQVPVLFCSFSGSASGSLVVSWRTIPHMSICCQVLTTRPSLI